jgi:valyl-tRNA synthetase
LAAFAAQGRDIKMSAERIEGYRNFANKIWNASRFVMMNLDEGFVANKEVLNEYSSPPDRWIISRLQEVTHEVNDALSEYRFNDAASSLYQFIWREYCDWYVELSKLALKSNSIQERRATQTALVVTLETLLRLLHPIMPFITEEIWQKLPVSTRGNADSIMTAHFPQPNDELRSPESEQIMRPAMDNTLAIRNIRGEINIPPSVKPKAIIRPRSEEILRNLEQTASYVTALSGLSEIHIAMDATIPPGSATDSTAWSVISIVLPDKAVDVYAERDRIMKEIAKLSKDIEVFSRKLSNKNFVDKAPREVVEKDAAKLEEFKAKRSKLEHSLTVLGS